MYSIGEPIKGELHSADASAIVAIPIFISGSPTAGGTATVRTLGTNEYIEVYNLSLISAAGGDIKIWLSTNNTLDTGELVFRGTLGVNSGVEMQNLHIAGPKAGTLWIQAPAGVVDVVVDGAVKKSGTTGSRESWREKVQA